LLFGDILKDDFQEMWNDSRLDVMRVMKADEDFTYAEQSKIEAALDSI